MTRFTGDSTKVKEVLTRLLLEERDSLAQGNIKKPLKATHYRSTVIGYLGLNEDNSPSLRSFEVWIQQLRKDLKVSNSLDQPWCIGASLACGHRIPSDILPVIIEMEQTFSIWSTLTIRRVRWIAQLYPLVKDLALKRFPDEREKQLSCLVMIAREYAIREQISEAMDKTHPDTTDMDRLFFVYADISDDALADVAMDNILKGKTKCNLSGLSTDEIEELKAKIGEHLMPTSLRVIDEYVRINGYVEKRIYFIEHQQEIMEIQKILKVVQNERTPGQTGRE